MKPCECDLPHCPECEPTWFHHRMDGCIDCIVVGCENCESCPSNAVTEERATMGE